MEKKILEKYSNKKLDSKTYLKMKMILRYMYSKKKSEQIYEKVKISNNNYTHYLKRK